ncbi:phage NrS-1 polymerase family protein [Halorarius halobius]|uniref:phage NrS-1 polymerase family protein n=1 Tax=Halorarius halobius TaxID=2962671 RepID=UPI0020CEAD8B|nr:hypothetical protein [Halorarius halobius]
MTDELPHAEALPAAMVARPQWLCWRTEDRDGKATKVPVDPSTESFASTTDAETWTDFADAREYATRTEVGVGFVFTDDDPLVGVDLDDCRDPDDGTLTDWARDIVERLDSFTEVSPSGTGVHVIVEGELPGGRNRHGDVELYETARFFTVTGDVLSAYPQSVRERPVPLEAIHTEYVAPDEEGATTASGDATDDWTAATGDGPGNDLGDEELLRKAKDASNGAKFARLYRGNTAGYESHSEADMALCSMLAFWTGGDAEQMDRLVRDSGLMRPKWDEVHFSDGATYGERTIERAVAGTTEFYEDSGSWQLFPEDATGNAGAVAASGSDESTSASEDESASTADPEVIETLEREIRRLEAANERLVAELQAECERREQLEEQLTEGNQSGILSWFQS